LTQQRKLFKRNCRNELLPASFLDKEIVITVPIVRIRGVSTLFVDGWSDVFGTVAFRTLKMRLGVVLTSANPPTARSPTHPYAAAPLPFSIGVLNVN